MDTITSQCVYSDSTHFDCIAQVDTGLDDFDSLRFDVLNIGTLSTYDIDDISVSSGVHSFDFDLTVSDDSSFSFTACLYNSGDDSIASVCSSVITFSSGTGGGIDASTTSLISSCNSWGTFKLVCIGLGDLFKFLFVPSTSGFASITGLRTDLNEKVPFGYFQMISDDISGAITDSASGSFSDVTINVFDTDLTIVSASSFTEKEVVAKFKLSAYNLNPNISLLGVEVSK